MSVISHEAVSVGAQAVGDAEPPHATLRDTAHWMSEALPGYQIEIVGGALIVAPTPTGQHNGVVHRILVQLLPQLSEDLVPLQVTSIESREGGEDYTTPDLVVLPREVEDADEWVFPADIAELAVEVVSKRTPGLDLRTKPRMYATWGVAAYLLVDPRNGTLVLHSDPRDGAYQAVHRMRFGDTVELPEPLKGVTVTTEEFPQY